MLGKNGKFEFRAYFWGNPLVLLVFLSNVGRETEEVRNNFFFFKEQNLRIGRTKE